MENGRTVLWNKSIFLFYLETNFLQSLFKLIHKLFLYEEHHSITSDPRNWIQDEAVQQRHLQDYGTFRKALIRCVEDRLTSILSKLLIQADVNNNLMLLKDTKYGDLWVKLFGAVVSDFQETTLIDGEKKNLQESKFPFSQQVSKMVNNAIKEQVNCGMWSYCDLFYHFTCIINSTFHKVLNMTCPYSLRYRVE